MLQNDIHSYSEFEFKNQIFKKLIFKRTFKSRIYLVFDWLRGRLESQLNVSTGFICRFTLHGHRVSQNADLLCAGESPLCSHCMIFLSVSSMIGSMSHRACADGNRWLLFPRHHELHVSIIRYAQNVRQHVTSSSLAQRVLYLYTLLQSLGPAPKWCAFLDNLTEELEEDQQPTGNPVTSHWNSVVYSNLMEMS